MRIERLALPELIVLYIALPIFSAYALFQTIVTPSLLLAYFASVYVLLSVFIALRKVRYDSRLLASINIEEAPPNITQLLSETTSRGILVNQLIIKTINENPKISQTELHNKLPISPALRLTKERIRHFILELENERIIRDIAPDVSEGKKCVYVLTKRGEWCLSAIKKYYPKYYISFLLRVVLKTHFRQKLPAFESIENS
jgi:hypothetical protein